MDADDVGVGDVLALWCGTCRPAKEKFYVIANLDPFLGFIINTRLGQYVEERPYLLACNVAMLRAEDNRFLDHDSWVDCCKVFEFSYEEIERDLRYAGRFIGRVGRDTAKNILSATTNSDTLKRRYQVALVESISQAIS